MPFGDIFLYDGAGAFSNKLTQAFRSISRKIGLESEDYTSIVARSNHDESTFITNELGYITYFLIRGNSVPFTMELDERIKDEFVRIMTSWISNGHKIVDSYSFFNDRMDEELKGIQASRSLTAKRLNLPVADKDDALRTMISGYAFRDIKVSAIYTPNIPRLKQGGASQAREVHPNIPLSRVAEQSLEQGGGEKLLQNHLNAVRAYKDFLSDERCSYDFQQLNQAQAIELMCQIADPKRPRRDITYLENNELDLSPTNTTTNLSESQMDSFIGQDFTDYIHPDHPVLFGRDVVEVGDRYFMNIVVEKLPLVPLPFYSLQKQIAASNIPFRVKTVIGESTVDAFKTDYHAASAQFGGVLGKGAQKQYQANYETLQYYAKNNAPTLCQQVFTTWVDGKENIPKLRENARTIKDKIEQWSYKGNCKARIDVITPRHSYFSTLPSFHNSVAPKLPIPLIDSISRTPFVRPALPSQDTGELLVTFPDGLLGKLDPLAGRTSSVSVTLGSSGRGKSVLYMHKRDAVIYQKGNNDLPFEFNIEIGSSTKASMDSLIIKNPELASKVAFLNVQNDESLAGSSTLRMNILGSPLGLRKPLPHLVSTIVSILEDRILGINGNALPNAAEMLTEVIKRTYEVNSNLSTAKRIDLRKVQGLETALRETGFDVSPNIEVDGISKSREFIGWNLVDHLIAAGRKDMAAKVQCLCEPLISDLTQRATDPDFKQNWIGQHNGTDLVTAFVRALNSLQDRYPFISSPSTTSIFEKHLVTFELGNVAQKTGTDADTYENRFWFALCTLYIRGTVFMSIDEHKHLIEDQIRRDQRHRPSATENETQDSKRISESILKHAIDRLYLIAGSKISVHCDELQSWMPAQGEGANFAVKIFSPMIFEGRKFGIEVAFSTQRPEHVRFFQDSGTMFYILGFTSPQDTKIISDALNIPEDEAEMYINSLKLDPARGVNAYVVMREVNNGIASQYRQEVYFPISGLEIWEYANSQAERIVRELVVNEFGYEDGMLMLYGALPAAGLSKEFAKAERDIRNSGAIDEEDDDDVRAQLIAEKVGQLIISKPIHFREMGRERVSGRIQ